MMCNYEQPLVFDHVILMKISGARQAKEIQKWINIRLQLLVALAIELRKLEEFNLMTTSSRLPLTNLGTRLVLLWPLDDLAVGGKSGLNNLIMITE